MKDAAEVVLAIGFVAVAVMVLYFVGAVIWHALGYIAIAILISGGALVAWVIWVEHFERKS